MWQTGHIVRRFNSTNRTSQRLPSGSRSQPPDDKSGLCPASLRRMVAHPGRTDQPETLPVRAGRQGPRRRIFRLGPRDERPPRRGSKGAQILRTTPPTTANALSSTPGRQIPPRSTVSCSTRRAEPCSARKRPTSSGCTTTEEHVLCASMSTDSSPTTFAPRRREGGLFTPACADEPDRHTPDSEVRARNDLKLGRRRSSQ